MTHIFRFYVLPVLLRQQREPRELPPEQRRGQPPPLMAISPNSSGIKRKGLFNYFVLKIGFTKPNHDVDFLLVKIAEESVVQTRVY